MHLKVYDTYHKKINFKLFVRLFVPPNFRNGWTDFTGLTLAALMIEEVSLHYFL